MATIVTKNSSTASAVPTTSDLVQGELAVNVTDKRIFTENASTQIVELGTNPSTITTATATVTGTLTANGTFASSNAVLTGGSINSTPIGATTPSTIVGSTITANTGFVGGLTGNVTGNLTGNVTGNVTGDLTGNVTGNLTAGSGTTTLNNLVVNGTVDFNAAVLSDLGSPVVSTDAATKGYVDTAVSNVIDAAPAALDTLNELAAALGDDANFSSTVTTALATKLPLAGGTMTGAIAMGTSKITGLGNPTAAQDAATKTYVDTQDALKLNLTGGTMSGAIAMGTNKITGVGDPTLAQDAATKAYTDSILGSATSAADSAAAAATSASNAATSASNAATSATASAASATAAAASYDAFDDRYLGDKASDPTLDNDGNALLTGALYFNTTSDDMKVYDGSAWNIAAISSASPTFTGTVTADGLSVDGVTTIKIPTGGNTVEAFNVYSTDGATNNAQIRVWLGANEYSTAGRGLRLDAGRDDGADGIATFYAVDQAEHSDYEAIKILTDGGVTFSYLGSNKLATTSTGIDVTGTATMDGLTVDNDSSTPIFINRNQAVDGYAITMNQADSTDGNSLSISYTTTTTGTVTPNTIFSSIEFEAQTHDWSTRKGNIKLKTTEGGVGHKDRMLIAYNGDISFYEDTGTTPKFFWDASAERLGIGTSSPAYALDVQDDSATRQVRIFRNASGTSALMIQNADTGSGSNDGLQLSVLSGGDAQIANLENTALRFLTNSTERLRIDSSGNVGIGTSSPASKLHINGSGAEEIRLTRTGGAGRSYSTSIGGSLEYNIRDESAGVNRLSISTAGNVGIGTSSPTEKLDVSGTVKATAFVGDGSGLTGVGGGGGAWVKVASVTASGSSSVSLEAFSDGYPMYVVVYSGVHGSAATANLFSRVKTTGSYITSGYYRNLSYHANTSSSAPSYSGGADSRFWLGRNIISSDTGASAVLYLPDTNSTGRQVMYSYGNSTRTESANSWGQCISATAAVTGINFFMNTGTIASGTFTLYGIDNS